MAQALRDAGNEVGGWHFNKCYEQLSSSTFDAAALAQHGVAFANLYVALHEVQGVHLFKVSPKLHRFCEISYRGWDCHGLPQCALDLQEGSKVEKGFVLR